jgi:hypothetical protein
MFGSEAAMTKYLCWAILLLGAVLAKILPTGNIEIAWAVNKNTHQGTSFNNVIFWILLITLAIWIVADISRRMRTGI